MRQAAGQDRLIAAPNLSKAMAEVAHQTHGKVELVF
jgi:hypothetical protein